MRRNRVNAILNNRARQRKMFGYICKIAVVSVILVALLLVCINKNKKQYVNYRETSNVDYKVYLKANDFYGTQYLEKDNQYIASLIDNITADFNYKLSIDESNIDYNYSYRIEAEVDVKEKSTNNSIYNYTEELLEEKSFSQNSNANVEINEQVKVDYNAYNERIKKFISVYELGGAESTLNINMYINIAGTSEKLENDSQDEYIISLSMPLTTNTIAIDINSDVITNNDSRMLCKKTEDCTLTNILMIIAGIIDVLLIVRFAKYTVSTRTAETIYDRELKKILNNYKSYIQKVNNNMDLEGYRVLEIDTFTDMLEIRDTIQEPILMIESDEKNEAYFMIPSKTEILYVYSLRVSDIKIRKKRLAEIIKV